MAGFDYPILICGDQFKKQMQHGTMSVLDFAAMAKSVGVQGVEYRTTSWKDMAKELPLVCDQVREAGLMVTYATFTKLFSRDEAQQQQLMRDLEDARTLGAKVIKVSGGERPGQGLEGEQVRKAVRTFLKRAEEVGVPVAIENGGSAPGNSWQEIKQAIEDFSSPFLGTLVDVGNYGRSGFDPV